MSCGEIVNAIINLGVAVGTLALAFLAVFGDSVKAWCIGPRLRIELRNTRATMLFPNGKRYYMLDVVNQRPKALARNCHVQVRKMWAPRIRRLVY